MIHNEELGTPIAHSASTGSMIDVNTRNKNNMHPVLMEAGLNGYAEIQTEKNAHLKKLVMHA
eukprot:5416576-Pleurochrysis_carterae.AAC.1